MAEQQLNQSTRLLIQQIVWLVRLRWIAAAVVILASGLDWLWLHWYPMAPWMVVIGGLIIAYNAVLRQRLRYYKTNSGQHAPIVWLHILPDLWCLAILTTWTGGLQSPLIGFFVFHMVFTSMLFQPAHAYGVALSAMLMLMGCLAVSDSLPQTFIERLMLVGWAVMLLVTIYLTNHIMYALRRNHWHLLARNRRVRALVKQLRKQQEAMIQQEKMVGLGQMAAGVAHEVANPLASMDSVLQLIQRNDKHLTPENIESLRQQVQRIKLTVRQLTDFAHPTDYHWERVSINDQVESALQMSRFDRRQRKVTIDKQLSSENRTCEVQPHALQQVLTNLLFNSLDALEEGQVYNPRLEVGTAFNGQFCRIWISDNGPGIDPEHMPRLFEPFFTTKPVGKGTGLGLAISYNLIRRQGGRIEFDNEPGEGVTATIHLPINREEGAVL